MIVIFGITGLDFPEQQKIVQNNNNNNNNKMGPKMLYWGILGCKFEKVLSHFQHLEIVKPQSFVQK